MREYTINGQHVLVEKRSLQYTDRLNDRTTCSFVVIAPSFAVEVGMDVRIEEDGQTIFAGTVDSELTYGDKVQYTAVTCVDYSQLIDKRAVAHSFTNTRAGQIVRTFIADVFAAEGIGEGNIQDGPIIAAAVFPYDNGNVAMNKLAELAGYSWYIDNEKCLHFFSRETYRAPYELTDHSPNYRDLRVQRTRGQYRNRQYIRAGQDLTQEIPLEKPTPKPDGVSQTFVVRLPVGAKPKIYLNGTMVDPADIGIGGLDQNKRWYWNKGKNTIYQDQSEVPLSTELLEISYRGLLPILLVADDPAEINSRQLIEGGTGIHEALIQEPNIDSQEAALNFALGKLEKYGYIPQIVSWYTYQPGLRAGQLISIANTQKSLSGDYLIESVAARDDNGLTRFDIKALDGSALGGWEQLFKTLIQGNKQLVIRENEVLILLNTVSEISSWAEQTRVNIYSCPIPSDELYPSEELIPC